MIKIYVANLGKYGEGELVGSWVTLPATEEQMENCFIKAKLGYINEYGEYVHGLVEDDIIYEEYAIHDYETDLDMRIDEYSSIEKLNEMAEKLAELSDWEFDVVKAMVETGNYYLDEALEKYENCQLMTEINDEEDLGYYYIEESGIYEIPSFLQGYIDYEKFGRDLMYNGNYYFTSYGCLEDFN